MAAKKLEKDNRPILSSNVNCESCSEEASTGDSVSAAEELKFWGGHTRSHSIFCRLDESDPDAYITTYRLVGVTRYYTHDVTASLPSTKSLMMRSKHDKVSLSTVSSQSR
jgi:hypothetical protein